MLTHSVSLYQYISLLTSDQVAVFNWTRICVPRDFWQGVTLRKHTIICLFLRMILTAVKAVFTILQPSRFKSLRACSAKTAEEKNRAKGVGRYRARSDAFLIYFFCRRFSHCSPTNRTPGTGYSRISVTNCMMYLFLSFRYWLPVLKILHALNSMIRRLISAVVLVLLRSVIFNQSYS